MKNIKVNYREIQCSPAEHDFESVVEQSQVENFHLVYLNSENKYLLNLVLNFSFFNLNEKNTNEIEVQVPVEFENETSPDAIQLYAPYLSGYKAATQTLSQRFINSNIGFQPQQFFQTPLKGIEGKLNNALKEMQKVQND